MKRQVLFAIGICLVSGSAEAQSEQNPSPYTQNDASRDMFCRRDAAARTGYVTPRQAAQNEQAKGSIGGLLGGAALGAIFGGRHAGSGAAIGAGAGLLAGSAIGASNARQAANEVRRRYSDAYYACMNAGAAPPPGYGYAPPPDAVDGPPPPPPGSDVPPPPAR